MATSSPPAAAAPSPDSICDDDALLSTTHRLLGAPLVVTTTDGRVVRGTFLALDRTGSLVLEGAVEHRRLAYIGPAKDGAAKEGGGEKEGGGGGGDGARDGGLHQWDTERALSHAVVPGDKVAKVEVAKKEWEARVGGA